MQDTHTNERDLFKILQDGNKHDAKALLASLNTLDTAEIQRTLRKTQKLYGEEYTLAYFIHQRFTKEKLEKYGFHNFLHALETIHTKQLFALFPHVDDKNRIQDLHGFIRRGMSPRNMNYYHCLDNYVLNFMDKIEDGSSNKYFQRALLLFEHGAPINPDTASKLLFAALRLAEKDDSPLVLRCLNAVRKRMPGLLNNNAVSVFAANNGNLSAIKWLIEDYKLSLSSIRCESALQGARLRKHTVIVEYIQQKRNEDSLEALAEETFSKTKHKKKKGHGHALATLSDSPRRATRNVYHSKSVSSEITSKEQENAVLNSAKK